MFFCSSATAAEPPAPLISLDPNLIYVLAVFALSLLAFLGYSLFRFRRYQSAITLGEERLKLSLWASGVEMWDWQIETGTLQRTSDSGVYTLPKIPDGTFPPNKEQIHPDDLARTSSELIDHLNGFNRLF